MILSSSLVLSTISSYLGIHPTHLLQNDIELLPDPLQPSHPTSGSIQSSSSSMILSISLILSTISSYLRIHPVQLLQHDLELLPDPLHHLIRHLLFLIGEVFLQRWYQCHYKDLLMNHFETKEAKSDKLGT